MRFGRIRNIMLILVTVLMLTGCNSAGSQEGDQWKGKSWYAYGTSITNVGKEGVYPIYLAKMSGMVLTNKGLSGGGIGDLGAYSKGQVYDAICNTTDGKQQADLITIETGANDIDENVELGTVYDTGRETLAGCLNDCIRYLQANTNAQIVVFPSPVTVTQEPSEKNAKVYEWTKMVEEICHINRVHFINADCGMGWAKLVSSEQGLYIVDQGHHSNLGGYIYAENIWYQLKQIPLFYSELPQ